MALSHQTRATVRHSRDRSSLLVAFVIVMGQVVAVTGWRRPVRRDQITRRQTHFRIDVNRADDQMLSLLPGVGPTLARRIVVYRLEHGPFEHLDDLTAVRMIGPATVARIGPYAVCCTGLVKSAAPRPGSHDPAARQRN